MNRKQTHLVPLLMGLSGALLAGCLDPSGTVSEDRNGNKEVFGTISRDDFMPAPGRGLAKSALPFGPEFKWHHYNILRSQQNGQLRWFLQTNCNDGFDARNIIRQAYAKWQPLVPFTFVEAGSAAEANTVIRFVNASSYTDQNGVSRNFWANADQVTLGLGWAPHETLRGLGFDFWGDIIINDLAQWNQTTTPSVVVTGRPGGGTATFASSLMETMTHEIGHTLGFDHDDSHPWNIMHGGGNQLGNGNLWDADVLTAAQLYQMGYEGAFGYERSHHLVVAGYQKVYGRFPDPGGLQAYRAALQNHRLPSRNSGWEYRNFLSEIGSSDEAFHFRSGGVPRNYIINLYAWFYDRVPSNSEVNAWLASYPSLTRRQIAEGFVYSPEWNLRYVMNLYTRMLGRQADQAGLQYWAGLLNNRALSPLSLDVEFAKSPEFYAVSNPANGTGNIIRVYQTMLGRTPSTGEVDAWRLWVD